MWALESIFEQVMVCPTLLERYGQHIIWKRNATTMACKTSASFRTPHFPFCATKEHGFLFAPLEM
jgi:hypothetical protein